LRHFETYPTFDPTWDVKVVEIDSLPFKEDQPLSLDRVGKAVAGVQACEIIG
jgi:hypothetical protein